MCSFAYLVIIHSSNLNVFPPTTLRRKVWQDPLISIFCTGFVEFKCNWNQDGDKIACTSLMEEATKIWEQLRIKLNQSTKLSSYREFYDLEGVTNDLCLVNALIL